ncbi:putative cytochrome P450 120 [Shimia sp. SK013]|uniref:cytochrome P450 n=1 Tax=Shimia sp. SK013 TaxID=1389006 RepID=UPI0006B5BFB0|nr:cytochrome P450 [Shimia sp. SK013]KPA20935.1 putative cytochrome P450 120 [Shimia sp. SK013]
MPATAAKSLSLNDIPHPPLTPVVGHTLDLLRDPIGLHMGAAATYGPVYKVKVLGQWRVSLGSADALEFILGDTQKLFSSYEGWDMLHRLFPGGLMLRDFDDHRAHRRIMQAAFRKPVMDAYRARLETATATLLTGWKTDNQFKFFPAIKDMTLRMGAAVFMGLDLDDPRADMLSSAFRAEVAAATSVIRKPVPFTKMARGMAARATLTQNFAMMIPERRAAPGDDFFSQMVLAADEDGNSWNADDLVDHFNFLMMAAHDTTASALTKVAWALATYPDWQDRIITEVDALPAGPIDDTGLASMQATDLVLKEALRLLPPVPLIPRRAVRDFEWQGHIIPAGTWVSATPGTVMMSPEYWTEPEQFDPDRFGPDRQEDRTHKYAWAPFGGGAHKCIGLHFATMQVKIFLAALLKTHRIERSDQTPVNWIRVPIPQPKGGLPVVLRKRAQ